MNNHQLETKLHQEAVKIKNDISALAGDNAAQFSKFEDDLKRIAGKAKEEVNTWAEDGVSQLSKSFEKLTGDAKETVVGAAESVKKDVGLGLSQYNAKAQEVADKVPGGFSRKAARYPWVTLSIALAVGFLLGCLLKPARNPNE